MLSTGQQRFLETQRVARLAVCFALAGGTLYVTIDEKPKRRTGPPLKRLRNIAENPAVAVVADRYDEDWAWLGWVMLQGRADILSDGSEHARAQVLLRARYPQLGAMNIEALPVIAVRVERVVSWGDLSVDGLASPAQPGLNED
jgi:PPOX class probable F420-dependent enzyme